MQNIRKFTRILFLMLSFGLMAVAAHGQGAPTRTARVNETTAGEQRPGSVLVYNAYTSDATATNVNSANTQFNLTNTSLNAAASIHLFFIGDDGRVADAFICLTANQTASFQASDIDPGTSGYVIAIATSATGCPIGFNFLTGSEDVRFKSGHAASLLAESFQALFSGPLPGCKASDTSVSLNFDGRVYSPAPRTLGLNDIPSRADGNDTMLIVNTFSGALDRITREPVPQYFGTLYDDSENVLSFTFGTQNCQVRGSLINSFPRTTPRFETFIPAGRTGWLQIFSTKEAAITGAVINFNPNAATKKNAFNGGFNLSHLNYTAGQMTVPVFPPNC